MARKLYSKEELESIITDYKNGMNDQEVANKYNRSIYSIRQKLKEAGVYRYAYKEWNKKELQKLRENYKFALWEELLEMLPGRDKESIISKAYHLGISRETYFWTEENIDILSQGYKEGKTIKEIQSDLDNKFGEASIRTKANKLGLKKREWWSEEELTFLRENYSKKYLDEICELLPNRAKDSIINMATKLKVISKDALERRFSKDEKEFISFYYKYMTDEEIGQALNRSAHCVQNKRLEMGLVKGEGNFVYEHNRYRLTNYIRNHNYDWRQRSIENCKNKCIVTGKDYQDVHHLHSFALMVDEALSELGLDDENFDEYTNEKLEKVAAKFYEVQDRYPLGVCLTREVHLKFHNLYGYDNNTENQFKDFYKQIKSGFIRVS